MRKNGSPKKRPRPLGGGEGRPYAHAFFVPLVTNAFQELEITITLYSGEQWFEIYERSDHLSLVNFEIEHGKSTERYAYNLRCVGLARKRASTVVGTRLGHTDLFVPVPGGGKEGPVLVTGPIATQRPESAEVLERWQTLTGRQGHPADSEFSLFLETTLATLVLEGAHFQKYQRLVECLAELMAGDGTPRATFSEVETLRRDLRSARLVERSWKVSRMDNAGILETTDGGDTFRAIPPLDEWNVGSLGINILYDAASDTGDVNTWLVTTEGGFYRTTNAGDDWTKVGGNITGFHGAPTTYYTSDGTLYCGASGHPVRSTDNGATWTSLDSLGAAQDFSVQGDGTNLYTGKSCACDGSPYNHAISTSLESDGLTWTDYQGGAQIFGNGPNGLRFEKTNRILYSANWLTGFWALRVIDP